jgi:hypothetical protein
MRVHPRRKTGEISGIFEKTAEIDADRTTTVFIDPAHSGRSLIFGSPTQGVALGGLITALQAGKTRALNLWNL